MFKNEKTDDDNIFVNYDTYKVKQLSVKRKIYLIF